MSTIIQYLVIVTWKYLQIIIVGHVCSCIEQPVPLLLHEGQVLLLHEMCHCMVARCSLWGCHWSFTSCWTRGIAVAWGCYMSCITVAWGVSCCKRGIAVAAVAWGVLLLQLLHEGSGQGVIAVAWGCYMSGSTVAWGLSLDVLLHEGCHWVCCCMRGVTVACCIYLKDLICARYWLVYVLRGGYGNHGILCSMNEQHWQQDCMQAVL